MGAANSPAIFQQKMDDLFHGFDIIHAYKDNILFINKGNWTDHIQELELTVIKLKGKGLKCNI